MIYTTVIWDVDGTLLDTHKGVINAVNTVLLGNGFAFLTKKEECMLVGTPKIAGFFRKHCKVPDEQALALSRQYREEYKSRHLFEATTYDGISDVMDTLQKRCVKQAIATMKRQDYATEICEHFGFDKYCFPIIGADNDNKLTKADLIKRCLQTLNVADLSSAVMIGDTDGDKIAAETVGIDFVGVNYGFGFNNVAGYANTPLDILKLAGE